MKTEFAIENPNADENTPDDEFEAYPSPEEVYNAMTPEERAEFDAYCRERAAEALAYQMEADAKYDVPPWAQWTDPSDLPF